MAWGFSSLAMIQAVGVAGGEAVFDVADVVGGADEGDGEGVDVFAYGEDEVFFVFFGERGDVDGDAGEVDALVFAEHAAVDDLADDVFAVDAVDDQLDEAVGEEDAGAVFEIFGEGGEGGADHGGGAFDLVRGDGEAVAGDEEDGLVVLELAGADLGALQVGEDADGLALFLRDGADHLDELGLLGVAAVREVEAGHVEAGADEIAEDGGGATGGAEGRDDLGAAGAVHAGMGACLLGCKGGVGRLMGHLGRLPVFLGAGR